MVNWGLGHTDIVKHQISTGDETALKQIVRRYLAAKIESVQYFMEALGIIQESIHADEEEIQENKVLHPLTVAQPGHKGQCLPTTPHRRQPEHSMGRAIFI